MRTSIAMVFSALLCGVVACVGTDGTASDLTGTDYAPRPLASIVLAPDSVDIAIGDEIQLSPAFLDREGKELKSSSVAPQWESSDTSIVRVSPRGVVTARSVGTAQVFVRSGKFYSRGKVRVRRYRNNNNNNNRPPVTEEPDSQPTAPEKPAPEPEKPAPEPEKPAPETPKPPPPPPVAEPEPTPPPPPVAPSTGRPMGVSPNALLSDDFSTYGSTSDLLRSVADFVGGTTSWKLKPLYNDGHNAQMAEIDRSVMYNGHPTLKYNQPGGTEKTPQLWVSLPDGQSLKKMWIRVKVRFSKGYTTDGVTPNYGKGYKLLGWGWKGFYGRGSLELGSITEYYIASYVFDDINSTTPDMKAGRVASEWTDERWYESIILVEVGAKTIRTRWWWGPDGQNLTLRANQTLTMLSGKPAPEVERFMLGLNFNQVRAANQNQAIWYGHWELIDGSKHSNPFNLPGI